MKGFGRITRSEREGTQDTFTPESMDALEMLDQLSEVVPKTGSELAKKKADFEEVLSKTMEHSLWLMRQSMPPLEGKVRKVESRLEKNRKSFDAKEMDLLYQKSFLDDQSKKFIVKLVKGGDFLKAYEMFWSKWHPGARRVTRAVFEATGGNKRPVMATLAAFGYSGLLHTIPQDPMKVLAWAMVLSTFGAPAIPVVVTSLTGFYVALGIPVAAAKYFERKKKARVQ